MRWDELRVYLSAYGTGYEGRVSVASPGQSQ